MGAIGALALRRLAARVRAGTVLLLSTGESREDVLRALEGVLDSITVAPNAGDSSIDIAMRFWHAPMQLDRWRVRSSVAIAAKAALDEAGVEIPFPQRTLHLETASAPVRVSRSDA